MTALPNLKILRITGMTNLNYLQYFPNLEELNCCYDNIHTLPPIVKLYLQGSEVEIIPTLNNLTCIECLNIKRIPYLFSTNYTQKILLYITLGL